MVGKLTGGAVAIGVAGMTSLGSLLAPDRLVASFEEDGATYGLYVDKFPDGDVYFSVWDDKGVVFASTEWMSAPQGVAFSCEQKEACFIAAGIDEATGVLKAYKLTSTLTPDSALTNSEFQSEELHGFAELMIDHQHTAYKALARRLNTPPDER